MATIRVDGKDYEVQDGNNLLDVCLSLGMDLPYFCWHPELGSVGACRQCAITQYKDEDDETGTLVMACLTPANDGARFSLRDDFSTGFRANVIEWLMTNHPHDCPVCEEGGECHLQDMTNMTGHVYRRYRFAKRTFRNQYLGPFINHEMNRCITCYRCVRFYRDYAGGTDLVERGVHNHVYFGRHSEGTLESEFSGNLVEICPTGVFTDKTLGERYSRKWDMRGAPSVCHGCGLGCATIVNERYGTVKRILNRYNGAVNRYFICDRGRFGYEYANADTRVRQAIMRTRRDTEAHAVDRPTALDRVAEMLAGARGIQTIGSPRASLESNYALRRMAGEDAFSNGLSRRDHALMQTAADILRASGLRSASLHDAEMSDAVLVLGEDLINTAPRLGLSVRQAARRNTMSTAKDFGVANWNDRGLRENIPSTVQSPVVIATANATKLDDCATRTLRLEEAETARLGYAIAHELDGQFPEVVNLSSDTREQAQAIAEALGQATHPLVVSGISSGSEAVLKAAEAVGLALGRREGQDPRISLVVPEANSLGVTLMGGEDVETALDRINAGEADTLIVLENDLYRRARAESVNAALDKARQVLVLEHTQHPTLEKADLVLPTTTFAEGNGTLVNNEGRAQRFLNVLPADGQVANAWRWLGHLQEVRGGSNPWSTLEDVTGACAQAFSVLEAIPEAAPDEHYRYRGSRLARAPHRYSGRTAMNAHKSVHEPTPPQDPDSPMSYTMEGHYGDQPSSTLPFLWTPGWNSEQSLNKFQDEVGGRLHGGNPGIRLIEPPQDRRSAESVSSDAIPAAQKSAKNELRLLPLHHIFGSDWLTALSPSVAERMPGPYLALNAEEAKRRNLQENQTLSLAADSGQVELPLRILAALPDGTAGLPVGLAGVPYIDLPGWGRLSAKES